MKRITPQTIDEIVRSVIKELGLERGLQEVKVYKIFEDLTGERITRLTRRKYISNRMLVVQLTSSIARNELMMIRGELTAEINRKLGTPLIDGIVLG